MAEITLNFSDEYGSASLKTVYYRDGVYTDEIIINEILIDCSYDISSYKVFPKVLNYYRQAIFGDFEPIILDAGAHIGIASIWFSVAFPRAKIIAVEPEPGNFRYLKKNTVDLNIKRVNGALASDENEMSIVDPSADPWAYRVSNCKGDIKIRGYTAASILDKYTAVDSLPFIAKIDIEGAECEVFSLNTEWAKKFPVLMIELHDWMLPGEANSRPFFKFISEGNFDVVYRKELIFAFNNDVLRNY